MKVPLILLLIMLQMASCASVSVEQKSMTHKLKHTGSSAEYPDQLFKNVKQYISNHFGWNRRNMKPESFVSLRKLENTYNRDFELSLESYKDAVLVSNTKAEIYRGIEKSKNMKVASLGGKYFIDPQYMKYFSRKASALNSQHTVENKMMQGGLNFRMSISPRAMLTIVDPETVPALSKIPDSEAQSMTIGKRIPQLMSNHIDQQAMANSGQLSSGQFLEGLMTGLSPSGLLSGGFNPQQFDGHIANFPQSKIPDYEAQSMTIGRRIEGYNPQSSNGKTDTLGTSDSIEVSDTEQGMNINPRVMLTTMGSMDEALHSQSMTNGEEIPQLMTNHKDNLRDIPQLMTNHKTISKQQDNLRDIPQLMTNHKTISKQLDNLRDLIPQLMSNHIDPEPEEKDNDGVEQPNTLDTSNLKAIRDTEQENFPIPDKMINHESESMFFDTREMMDHGQTAFGIAPNVNRRQIVSSNTSATTLHLPYNAIVRGVKNYKYSDTSRVQWFKKAGLLLKDKPDNPETYFRTWKYTISLFGNDHLSKHTYSKNFPSLQLRKMVEEMHLSDIFEKLFWPFVYENAFMNQKLALLGLIGIETDAYKQKYEFYNSLQNVQTIQIPVSDHIVYSFNDPSIVNGLNRSGLLETSHVYTQEGRHFFNAQEQAVITTKLDAAMVLINNTMPELYRAIQQTIACIAFYKAEDSGITGGSISSALGLIWQDPSVYREQSVEYYAEQIVHEYIHTSLFLSDFVHGIFVDRDLLMKAKVYSPIRKQLRDFDKTFHATHVTIGVAVFHARCGNWEKAVKFAKPIREAMNGLVEMNNALGVLNESGEAMLRAMEDFMTVIRLKM